MLGVTIDHKLDFNSHINKICKKGARKINALSRLSYHLNDEQKFLTSNSFVQS